MAKATLSVAGGPGSGRGFEVTDGLEIGRGLAALSDITDPMISRRHARFGLDAAGRLTIEDLGSRNGTRVNGRLTTGREALTVGDVIDLGDTTLEVTAIDVADVAAAEQQTKLKRAAVHDEAESRSATRSRSIAQGLPVPSVRSIVTGVRIRAALATLAVVVLLWVVLFIQERNGDDPGLKKKPVAAAPATSTQTTVSPTTSTTTTKTS